MAKIPNGLLMFIEYIHRVCALHWVLYILCSVLYNSSTVLITDSHPLLKLSVDVFECLSYGAPFVIYVKFIILQLLLGISQLMGQLCENLASLKKINTYRRLNISISSYGRSLQFQSLKKKNK